MPLKSRWGIAYTLLAVLPLASGAALLVHVLAHVSLGLALGAGAIILLIAGSFVWWQMPPVYRREVAARVRIGIVAGLLATASYDLIRWITVTVFHDTFWPFDIFGVFGRAIAGTGLNPFLLTTIGITYHYLNGMCFASAYAILFANRSWWIGILWALGLETLMLAIYPGWLHIQAMQEFVSVSMIGHVTYGAVLGGMSSWLWRRRHAEGMAPAI